MESWLQVGEVRLEAYFQRYRLEGNETSFVGEIPVGISVGISEWIDGEPMDNVLARADAALYSAKESGRNQFVVAAPV